MTKTQMLAEINEMVTNLIEFHNKTNSMKAHSVQFLGINKPPLTGTRGNVVEIDNNLQIMLEFEDYLGTTDYLPLAMFDSMIISNVHIALTIMVNETIKYVYLIIEMFSDDAQTRTEVYDKVYHNEKDAKNILKQIVASRKKEDWLEPFFDKNGKLIEDNINGFLDYEESDRNFYICTPNGDWHSAYVERRMIF